jgi:RimJ/RimL family protein N-acetyltransferase
MKFDESVFERFPVLETEKLILREMSLNDAKEIFEIYTSKKALRYLGKHPYKNIKEAKERIDTALVAYKKKEGIRWGITLKNSDKLLGSASIWRIVREHFRGEIGYELSPEYWKKGIMSEALIAIINFAFTNMNLHTIEANIDPENTASEKLLLKLGFEKEGHLKESFYFKGKFEDNAVYSLIKN